MFTRLKLTRFKNFENAELRLGPFTLLIGRNAAGKSNIRDAFRVLHAIGRGYTLAEIFGGKWVGGAQQWTGIRGGAERIGFRGAESFGLEVESEFPRSFEQRKARLEYRLEIDASATLPPKVLSEHYSQDYAGYLTDSGIDTLKGGYDAFPTSQQEDAQLSVQIKPIPFGINKALTLNFSADRPALFQLIQTEPNSASIAMLSPADEANANLLRSLANRELGLLRSLRFFDLSPDAMRGASAPGQVELSERGENLSAVLQHICLEPGRREEVIHWLRALTPMDVVELNFLKDPRGQVLLELVEADGTHVLTDSASDGTLRFLGLLAALYSVRGTIVLEELENGLLPSRLRLVLELLKTRTSEGEVQVIATTHSPALLSLLDDEQLKHASLVYRNEGEASSQIVPLLDLPDAARILATQDRSSLLASGWFEDMVEFAASRRELNASAGGGTR